MITSLIRTVDHHDRFDFRGPRFLRVGDDIPDVDLGPYVTVVVVATVAAIVVVAHAWTHG